MPEERTILYEMELYVERDVVLARQRARLISELLQFDSQTQTRIATAVSEIARNAFRYAHGGKVIYAIVVGTAAAFEIVVSDKGPGIPHLQTILDERYESRTGMGIGIIGARRLMDSCQIYTDVSTGTTVKLQKLILPSVIIEPSLTARIHAKLALHVPPTPFDTVRKENIALSQAFEQLQRREMELAQANQELEAMNKSVVSLYAELDEKAIALEQSNRELEETNRGIIALYAELDEKASSLQKASETKTRFLSHISHEFRTPLNSILSLSRLLLDHATTSWTSEQDKQIAFIRRSAEELVELVNDLLDTAKVEAGMIAVNVKAFTVSDLFASLRGMFKPLLVHRPLIELIIEEPVAIPPLLTDEAKVAQILRNFISNALKFTPAGQVRVTASLDGQERILIAVADTGIGTTPEDQIRVFDEFFQVQGDHQKNITGTGLGLPLSKNLARLLGGDVSVSSKPGVGSTFVVLLPLKYSVAAEPPAAEEPAFGKARLLSLAISSQTAPTALSSMPMTHNRRALIIDDNDIARYLLSDLLVDERFTVTEASSGDVGLEMAKAEHPDVIFLDLVMPGIDGFGVLEALKASPKTKDIPVIINTSKPLSPAEAKLLEQKAAAVIEKNNTSRSEALAQVRCALTAAEAGREPKMGDP